MCNILGKIDLTNNGGKRPTGEKPGDNESKQKNYCDIGNDTFYLTKTIRKFIMDVIDKEKKNFRSITKLSLYNKLGQGIFHRKLISFAHNWSEEVQVVFYEKGMKQYECVKEQSCQLMFG